jgi:hypothetical protein
MDTKIIVVGSAKAGTLERRRPRIRFTGEWLKPLGFTPDSFVRFSRDQGVVTFTLIASPVKTRIVHSSIDLLQVKQTKHNGKFTSHFEIKGFWMNEIGFTIGSIIAVQFEYGMIKAMTVDIESIVSCSQQ